MGLEAGPVSPVHWGFALDSAGNLYVADGGNATIRQMTPSVSAGQTNWVVSTIAGSPGIAGTADGTGTAARFNGPTAIAVAGTGSLYVADGGNSIIRKMTSARLRGTD